MKYKVVYNKKACIGIGQCAIMSELWSINNEGKAQLEGSNEVSPNIFELSIEESDYAQQLQAAKSCPVGAIKIIKVD